MQKYLEENGEEKKEQSKEIITYPYKSHGYMAVFKNFDVTSKGKEKCKKERISEELMIVWELSNELKRMDEPPHLIHYSWEHTSILMAYWGFRDQLEIETQEEFEQIIMSLTTDIQKDWKSQNISLKEITGVLCSDYIFNRDILSIVFNTEEDKEILYSLIQAEECSIKGMKEHAFSISQIAKDILDNNKERHAIYAL